MAETVNLPRDSTLRELVAVQKASIIASGNTAAIDRLYGSLVRAAKSVEEVNTLRGLVEHLLEGGRDDAQ